VAGRHEVVARRFEKRTAPADAPATKRYEAVASDLALLVAHEHARADDERRRREEVELTASQLAVMVAHEHAEAERERAARRRAESEAAKLRDLLTNGTDEFRQGKRKGTRNKRG
jgi:hypothetical protein